MKSLFGMLVVALLAAPAFAESGAKRYIIGFRPEAGEAQRELALGRLGGTKVESLDALGAVVADVKDETKVSMLSDAEFESFGLSFIEEDFFINWLLNASFQGTPLVPAMAELKALRFGAATAENPLPAGVQAAEVPWGIRRVNAANAWAKTRGAGVKVAVIDTGIDANHPDLAGQVAGGFNAVEKGKSWMDDNSHGTHVSGTIAGKLDGKGVVGVAPNARLYAVKVLNAEGGGSLTSIIKGLVWAAENKMDVANLSLGSPMGSVFMRLALDYAVSRGVTVVCAAGNSGGSVGYPAAYPSAIAVAASDSSDKIAKFSSRGSEVDLIAPGVGVQSTIPGGGYDSYNGTSMATPHVAGLAALAVSRGARGPAGVRSALTRAASSIGLSPKEEGKGLVDAARLVQ